MYRHSQPEPKVFQAQITIFRELHSKNINDEGTIPVHEQFMSLPRQGHPLLLHARSRHLPAPNTIHSCLLFEQFKPPSSAMIISMLDLNQTATQKPLIEPRTVGQFNITQ